MINIIPINSSIEINGLFSRPHNSAFKISGGLTTKIKSFLIIVMLELNTPLTIRMESKISFDFLSTQRLQQVERHQKIML